MILISVVVVVPAMVEVLRGGKSRRTGISWSRTRSSTGRRILTECVQGSFLRNLTRRRS